MPALELALESKFRESGDSPMPFELSWRPGGSVGFLINLFGFFELTMVVVRGREVWWIACMFLGGIALASVTTTRVEEEEEASRQRRSRDSK